MIGEIPDRNLLARRNVDWCLLYSREWKWETLTTMSALKTERNAWRIYRSMIFKLYPDEADSFLFCRKKLEWSCAKNSRRKIAEGSPDLPVSWRRDPGRPTKWWKNRKWLKMTSERCRPIVTRTRAHSAGTWFQSQRVDKQHDWG